MRKQYQIENLDCAHCAMKMQEAAEKIDGVEYVNVNFISMKLTLEAKDENFSRVFAKVEKECRKIEADVSFHENRYRLSSNQKKEVFRLILSFLFFILAILLSRFGITKEGGFLFLLSFLPAYFISGFGVIRKSFLGIVHGKWFDENFLMTLATFGAFAIGEAGEGVMVMLLYGIGEFFQELAVSKSRKNVTELMDIRPDGANLLQKGKLVRISPEKVEVGSIIVVRPGEKIPLDGVVLEGNSFVDTASLTGESIPKEISPGGAVISGCVNMNAPLTIRTEKNFSESSVSKIIRLIEDAESGRSKAERFISRFARYYTPAVVFFALAFAIIPPLFGADLSHWIHKAITCLVISCPCALVISVPLAFFAGIGCAGSNGILMKGAESLEKLAKAKHFAFDKTGTLTKGKFLVTAVHPDKIDEAELLEIATICEHYSNHPISQSLKNAYRKEIDVTRIGKMEEIPGEGIVAHVDNKKYLVGSHKLLDRFAIPVVPCEKCDHKGTVVHVAEESTYLGHILISDVLREDSASAILELRAQGNIKLSLLTGDGRAIAENVGNELGFDSVYADLLPQDKLSIVDRLQKKSGEGIVFVGDGINDTPVLAKAHLSIAMGGIGADAAIEAADIVLIDDKPSKIPLAVRISKKALGIIWENIFLSVGVKIFVLILNLILGEEGVPVALAIFADVGICLIAILNSTRVLRIKK